MATELKIVMGQLNFLVGDIPGNAKKIIAAAKAAQRHFAADLLVLPELALTGYPPEDLLFRPDFHHQIQLALQDICQQVTTMDLIIGYPERQGDALYDAAVYIKQGKIYSHYRKAELPNYGVFDEKRYFTADENPLVITVKDIKLGITICEDLWLPTMAQCSREQGAEAIISLNASPFDMRKLDQRQQALQARVQENNIPIIYVHGIGGQDELVFDGGSLAMDSRGTIQVQGPQFKEALLPVTLQKKQKVSLQAGDIVPSLNTEESIYQALVLAVKDYTEKNGFNGALLGLSGGIDSALTFAIACDALGHQNVEAILLPSRHTSEMSISDAQEMAKHLKAECRLISIETAYQSFLDSLHEEFINLPVDKTEENIQARCRGVILMAISNKKGQLLLTTGNKSEMAVGYATLYGDMAGGFAVIKDVPKMWVYRLANYRNSLSPVIPQRIIDRPPTAELAPDQTDQDTLPPYEELDQILQYYVEEDYSIADLVKQGFKQNTIQQVIHMVDRSEYKRRQAPPGPRITIRAFSRERRYPITSGFRCDRHKIV